MTHAASMLLFILIIFLHSITFKLNSCIVWGCKGTLSLINCYIWPFYADYCTPKRYLYLYVD